MSVNSNVEINNQHDLDEDTDSLPEDEDQDIASASGLGDEYGETDSTSVERAIVIPPTTKVEKDDDDFRPVKKRKVQENNEGTEVDEVCSENENQGIIVCKHVGSGLFNLSRAVVKFWSSSYSIIKMWPSIWTEVNATLDNINYNFMIFSCVDKWLKGSGGKCPQCNARAKKGHIRIIYAKAISVVDTTERDQALKVRILNID